MTDQQKIQQLSQAIGQKNFTQAKTILATLPPATIVNGFMYYSYQGYYPLAHAVQSKNLEFIKYIVETYHVPVTNMCGTNDVHFHMSDVRQFDAFCWAIEKHSDAATLSYLFNMGNLKKVINDQRFEIQLMDASCAVEQCNFFDMTYLHVAAYYKNCEAIHMLLQHGANAQLPCSSNAKGAMNGPKAVQMSTCGHLKGKSCTCVKIVPYL